MNISLPKYRIGFVTTTEDFPAPLASVWQALLFYEEVGIAPPFLLRWLLPVPLGICGSQTETETGSELTCRYAGGYLRKRVTEIAEMRRFAFDVVEQNLALRGVRLLGGEYNFQSLAPERTRVALSTRYASPHRPGWLCARLEAALCHCFHRHLLAAMRERLATIAPSPAAV